MLQPQRIGGQNRYSRIGITAPRQDIENDVGGMDAVGEGFGAGCLDSRQAVGQHRRQHLDHLAVAIIRALQLTPHAPQAGRQKPVLEGGTVTPCAGLSGEHRHVMPWVIGRLAAAEAAAMLADDRAILADHNAIGIGLDLDRPSHGA